MQLHHSKTERHTHTFAAVFTVLDPSDFGVDRTLVRVGVRKIVVDQPDSEAKMRQRVPAKQQSLCCVGENKFRRLKLQFETGWRRREATQIQMHIPRGDDFVASWFSLFTVILLWVGLTTHN
jgi:hypothetical protein